MGTPLFPTMPTDPRQRVEQARGPTSLFPTGEPADAERFRQSLRLGQKQPAADSARVLSLTQKTGLPPDVVQRNADEVAGEQRTRDLDAEQFRQNYPSLAKYITAHPLQASVAEP